MKSSNARDTNIEMLRQVAKKMGILRKKVVFLGGTVMPFLITLPIPLDFRPSKDVDCIFDSDSKQGLYGFEDELWERGFKKTSTGAVCVWALDNIKVEVLPASPVLSFDNRWCAEAMQSAQQINIGKNMIVNITSAPYFLGIKLNAFNRRGRDNYANSFDIYDLLLIVAGRPEIENEIPEQASSELKAYLSSELEKLLNKSAVLHELGPRYSPGNQEFERLLPDMVARIERIITKNRIV